MTSQRVSAIYPQSQSILQLKIVDKVEILTLQDNYIDGVSYDSLMVFLMIVMTSFKELIQLKMPMANIPTAFLQNMVSQL